MKTAKEQFAHMREVVEIEAVGAKLERPKRHCAECGGELELTHGRHARKWRWAHVGCTECRYDATWHGILFETEDEARKAEVIFK